jgi:hypothetical protein
MALVEVPTGVRNAVEALTATAIRKGSGDIPEEVAAISAIGAISTAVAELLMAWLKVVVSKKIPLSSRLGCH